MVDIQSKYLKNIPEGKKNNQRDFSGPGSNNPSDSQADYVELKFHNAHVSMLTMHVE